MTSIKAAAILVAAGQGERLAGFTDGTPKQFMHLNQAPLFIWSLTALAKHPLIEQILLTVPDTWQNRATDLIANYLPECKSRIALIAGGSTRQQSVYQALEKLAAGESIPDYILIHDAVRPFITSDLLDRIFEHLNACDAVTLAIALSDSIKSVKDDNTVLEDLDRSKFVLVQTPQAAKFELLLEAHRAAKFKQTEVTDDASIIKAYGAPVTVIIGSKLNFKITEPADLLIAQVLTEHYNWSPGKIHYKFLNSIAASKNNIPASNVKLNT